MVSADAKTVIRSGRHARYCRVALLSLIILAALFTAMPWVRAAAIQLVVQRGRAFLVKSVTIAAGDTIRFANDDKFNHQIFIDAPALQFDSSEQLPDEYIDVKFSKPGKYTVLCHIHPTMKLIVTVK